MKATFISRQQEIRYIKQTFTEALSEALNLTEVQAPLLTDPSQGTQDTLSGYEKAVQVSVSSLQQQYEVVHSLAKWKRAVLGRYDFAVGEGIVAQMKALRPDEEALSEIHSVLVDQWDWEQVIAKTTRTEAQLHYTVQQIYAALQHTLKSYTETFTTRIPVLTLPAKIHFVTTQELLTRYPNLSPKEREHAISKEHGAVFIQNVGAALSDGKAHDIRAPDYDDWQLNGDILVWNPVLGKSLELSSMGIRVDRAALLKQLQSAGRADDAEKPWHQLLLAEKLPQTVGGGIGQSRLVMWIMQLPHIGYVQQSVWAPATHAAHAELL
ncbi:aspartate--ammonia ligase, AsnA-type [Idiomarina sp. A28L]|uniref:aspartate--ammonia ligase n=1 Tax=Idiomarina sp. A28L TaxID=1036674 RepID=UPI0002138CDC|nr:aspartate--ammonia ligase [Idiomarina sp. A28L]EGN74644.1 aspartate--ammonia ligase, AsnA-type [Idiomarina sp. A28L]